MKLRQQFIQQQKQTNTAQAQLNQATAQAIAKMEVHLGQLAVSVGGKEKWQFPSQTVPNPKVQLNAQNALRGQFGINRTPGLPHDEVQAIHTLRSGKQVDNQVRMPEEMNVNAGKPNKDKGQDVQEKGEMNQAPIENHPVTPYIPKAPYP
ncbi:hypothetical protein MRB53_013937 [Persea americana]|uniref:Uncharacterized protein n=1 Tax=Persea americana TaxID=3435 RepID=A0ACC2K9S3_PERAE|nr:hypothetical protein MRB53_013937 [Persea americana]